MKWVIAKTKGKKPIARFQHTMHLVKELNAIVIYGGRTNQSEQYCLADIAVLTLHDLT